MEIFITTEDGKLLTTEDNVFLILDPLIFADAKRTFAVIPRTINFEILQKIQIDSDS